MPARFLLLFLLSVLPAISAQPNFVLIISDDHAWSDYGFMAHPVIRTPNLDKLASQSLAFTRGYVPTSLCRTSLASLMTGLYPHQHRITGNDPPGDPHSHTTDVRLERIRVEDVLAEARSISANEALRR